MRAEVKIGLIVGAVAIAGAAIWWFSGNENELDNLSIDKTTMDATAAGKTTLAGDETPARSGARRPGQASATPRPTRRTGASPRPGRTASKLEQPPATARPKPGSSVKPTLPAARVAQPASPTTSADQQTTPESAKTSEERPAGRSGPPGTAAASDRPADTPPTPTVGPPRRRETGAPETTSTPRPANLPRPSAMKTYTIQRGDRLIDLAREEYGDGTLWEALKAVNPGIDENRLEIGAKIKIPTEADARRLVRTARGQETPPVPTPPSDRERARPGQATYVVEAGDTLTKIARNVLKDAKRWEEIFELNRDRLESADVLRVGLELRMPSLKKD